MDNEIKSQSREEHLHPQDRVLNIESRFVKTFFKLLDDRGILELLSYPEISRLKDSRSKNATTTERKELIDKFIEFHQLAKDSGLDKFPNNLAYRTVNFTDIRNLNEAVEQSKIYGGMNPADTRVGVCVSLSNKAIEIARTYSLQDDKPLVIFIYDMNKLQPLTKEEIEADDSTKFWGGYGVKPKNGYQLQDTLICMIKLENPGTKKQ